MVSVETNAPVVTSSHSHRQKKSVADSSQTGRWTREEHLLFLQGLQQFGKEWKKIAKVVKTRTLVQIRSHAQKYFSKLAAAEQSGQEVEGNLLMDGKRKKNVQKKNVPAGNKRATNSPALVITPMVPPQIIPPVPEHFTLPAASPAMFEPAPITHHSPQFPSVPLTLANNQHLAPQQPLFQPVQLHHHQQPPPPTPQPHQQAVHTRVFSPSSHQQPLPLPPQPPQPPMSMPRPIFTPPLANPTFTTFAPMPTMSCLPTAFQLIKEESATVGDGEESRSVRGSLADSRDGSTSTSSLSSYATTTDGMDDRLDPLDLFTPEELELFVHDFLPEEMTKRTVQVPPGLTDKYNGDLVFDSEVIADWLQVEDGSTPTGATTSEPTTLPWGTDFHPFSY